MGHRLVGRQKVARTRAVLLLALALGATACFILPAALPREGVQVERIRAPSISVAATRDHACAVRADGAAWCWGENLGGELGAKLVENVEKTPVRARVPKLASIAVGYRTTCGLTAEGEVFCWGVLAPGMHDSSGPAPRALGGRVRFRNVAPGYTFACGVGTDGTAWCWGYNAHTSLGHEGGSSRTPVKVATTERFTQVAAAADNTSDPHVCGVTVKGGVICWGSNRHGETGGPNQTDRLGWRDQLPREVPLSVQAKFIAVGGWQSCMLDTDGAAWCWGDNMDGALGVAHAPHSCGRFTYDEDYYTIECARTPVRVETDKRFTSLALGSNHACGLTADGDVWCWGSGRSGTLPKGVAARLAVPRLAPVPADSGARYTSLSAGDNRTCATTERGEIVCWKYMIVTRADLDLVTWTTGYFLKQVAIVLFFVGLGVLWGTAQGHPASGATVGFIAGLVAVFLILLWDVWRGLSSIR